MFRSFSIPRVVPMLSLALVIHVPAARAQQIRSPYRFVEENQTLGIFAGYLSTAPGTVKLGPRSAPIVGGRYTIRLSGPFSVEAEAGLVSTSRVVWNAGEELAEPTRVGEADLSLFLPSGALRFNLTGPRTFHGVMPYVLAGGGVVVPLKADDALNEDLAPDARYRFGTSFAGHLGGGAEWFALGRLTLRGDARLVFWEVTVPGAFRAQDRQLPTREWVQNLLLGASLSYRF